MKYYPNGVSELFNAEKPKENEPQIILLFNAPLWFCNKFGQSQDNEESKLDIIKEIKEVGNEVKKRSRKNI